MTRQAPEIAPVVAGQSNRPLGIYGSYYKLFRCSDGRLRLNLISEEEYIESKKRPISVDDVSSTTDVPPAGCPHHHNYHAPHPAARQTSSSAASSVIATAPQKRFHCVPEQATQPGRIKRQRTVVDGAPAGAEGAHQSVKRQKRDRIVRSTVAVADLIAEYIPLGVPVVNSPSTCIDSTSSTDADSSSSSACDGSFQQLIPTALHSLQHSQAPGTPAIWNSWIQTVGKRFPMADMSVRQVLDTLDRRPEAHIED